MIQIEVTTKCNLTCFYCTGRHLPQKDMTLETFQQILHDTPSYQPIHLQGEGEPLLHPKFSEFLRLARETKRQVTTTTNGTVPFDILQVHQLQVSLDTLDPEVAKTSGRTHLEKTLSNLELWVSVAPQRLMIRVTDFGQDLQPVIALCRKWHLPMAVQRLNQKEDYGVCYQTQPINLPDEIERTHCRYPSTHLYYTVDGQRLPCCFIKFPTQSYEENREAFARNQVPRDCRGCQFLTIVKKR